MTSTQKTLLCILRCALRDQRWTPEPVNWRELLELAGAHKLLPLCFEAAHEALRRDDPALFAQVRQQVRNQVLLQAIRTEEFLELNRRLRTGGITPLVVKGIHCRNLYPRPDHRPSADEDIWIRPEEFERCHDILTMFGMQTACTPDQRQTEYEIPYRKPGSSLYIELHKHLFPPQSRAYGDWNRFFDGSHDHPIEADGVLTLPPTDHLLYLLCHALKHFLHSGFGLRQICDILLFSRQYQDAIDWQTLLTRCRQLRADRFTAAILRIGAVHLGFDLGFLPRCWQMDVDEGPLLEDVLDAGVYGSSELSRQHSSAITLTAAAAEKQDKKPRSGLVAAAFPPASKLEGRYPWLKERPYLLPAAWGHRLLGYLQETRHSSDSSAAEALKLGGERLKLLKKYGILK